MTQLPPEHKELTMDEFLLLQFMTALASNSAVAINPVLVKQIAKDYVNIFKKE
jgi:hypothetical protein